MTRHDLARLADLAEADLSLFISRARQARSRFRKLVLCRALCQGAALHYIDHKNGVKDLDVYTFFRADKGKPWPYRRRGTADFGKPKFGIHPEDVGLNRAPISSSRVQPVRASICLLTSVMMP